jgi:hypothetical protein
VTQNKPQNFGDQQKVVNILVEDSISFMIDITDPDNSLTCGWLLQEVVKRYNHELMTAGIRDK